MGPSWVEIRVIRDNVKFMDGRTPLSHGHGKWKAGSLARCNLALSYLHHDLHRRSLRRKLAISGDSTRRDAGGSRSGQIDVPAALYRQAMLRAMCRIRDRTRVAASPVEAAAFSDGLPAFLAPHHTYSSCQRLCDRGPFDQGHLYRPVLRAAVDIRRVFPADNEDTHIHLIENLRPCITADGAHPPPPHPAAEPRQAGS